jgi:enoyl-CoA hydratase
MLFESKHLRISAEEGIATLWLRFPGELANALDLARLCELDEALQTVAESPSVQILVIRSAGPNGFCAGIRPEVMAGLTMPADRAAFAWFGQQVFERLARLDAVTIAVIDGPCLGAGLELALACDYRLCVARVTTHLGFPDRLACFGGSGRLRNLIGRKADRFLASGQTLSGREARALKLVDLAFCERRARIELRSFLDRLELRPVKPHPPCEPGGLAAERRSFAAFIPQPGSPPLPIVTRNPIPPIPDTIGLLGTDLDAATLAAEAVLRGSTAVVYGDLSLVYGGIDAALARGFITPLEAEQARSRVRSSESLSEFRRAGLVFVAEGHNPHRLAATVLPRARVCLIRRRTDVPPDPGQYIRGDKPNDSDWTDLEAFPHPFRLVQVRFWERKRIAFLPNSSSDTDAAAALSAWLKLLGYQHFVVPPEHILTHTQAPRTKRAQSFPLVAVRA